jgi:hypothetical protein
MDNNWFNEFVDILKTALKTKLSTFLNFFFPGLLILEILFKKGFYNDNIETLYDLILYILWGCLLSVLFNASFNVSIEEILKSSLIVRKTPLGNGAADMLSETIFKEIKKNKFMMDYIEDIIESYTFIFSGIRVGLLYIINKIIQIVIIFVMMKINILRRMPIDINILSIVFSFIMLNVFNKTLKNIFIKASGKKLRKHYEMTGSIDS